MNINENPQQPPALPRQRMRLGCRMAAWVLGIILFSKVDNILWGYIGLPTVTAMTVILAGGAGLFLIVAIWQRVFRKKWPSGTVFVLLVFLAFEPYFPPPNAMHLIGYSMRVKEKLDFPAVRAWAQAYAFSAESTSSSSEPEYRVDTLYTTTSSVPRSWLRLGPWFSIRRSDRTVTISNGGTFMDHYGVTIGPDAKKRAGQWSYFDRETIIKLDDDVHVWCTTSD